MKVKMIDIAHELNISVAAVSMAINNKNGVSDETRSKVLDLAREKGYELRKIKYKQKSDGTVKKYIKLLRIQKHGLVAIDTAFFSRVIDGIEEECKRCNYELLVSNCRLDEINNQWILREFASYVSGVIILATELESQDVHMFDAIDKPFVMLDSYFPGKEWDFVLMNNFDAVYQAMNYLKQCGHQVIGYLKSNTPIYNFNERFRSYQYILHMMNIKYNAQDTYLLTPTIQGAYNDMKQRLVKHPTIKPTAFIADNDIIAAGAINAMKDAGIKIPMDTSIVGIDDMPFSQVIDPTLTTSRVYKNEIGREAVRTLVNKINHKKTVSKKVEVNTHLVIRNSVKSINLEK